jgi:hypothetical protein
MTLLDRVRSEISTEPKTITELCEQFNELDEIRIMGCIARLQMEGIVSMVDFYKGYEPDGSAFYLARYAKTGAGGDDSDLP